MPVLPAHQWEFSRETIASWRSEFDLPPAWDGYSIVWDELSDPIFSIYLENGQLAKDDPCPNCGDESIDQLQASGVIPELHLLLGIPEDECRYGEVHLCLFRCKRCTLDRVYTRFDSSHWVLDETDYRPIGSLHNEGVPDLFEVFAEEVKAQRDAEAAKGLAEILDFGAFPREPRESS